MVFCPIQETGIRQLRIRFFIQCLNIQASSPVEIQAYLDLSSDICRLFKEISQFSMPPIVHLRLLVSLIIKEISVNNFQLS